MKNLGTFAAGVVVGAVGLVGLAVAAVTFDKEIDELLENLGKESKPENSQKPKKVSVGDKVQWESNGQLMFKEPKEVKQVLESSFGQFVIVEGCNTGLPLEEVTVV